MDFGLAERLEEGKEVCVMAGTADFVCPEVVNYTPVCCQSDIWYWVQ